MTSDPRAREATTHGVCCFGVADSVFGIHLRLVREIAPELAVTPVCTAPRFVAGLSNLRGQIVTVVDLAARMGLGVTRPDAASRLVVLKTTSELAELGGVCPDDFVTSEAKVGLLVGSITDLVRPDAGAIGPPPPHLPKEARRFVWAVGQVGGRSVGLLDTRELLGVGEHDG